MAIRGVDTNNDDGLDIKEAAPRLVVLYTSWNPISDEF